MKQEHYTDGTFQMQMDEFSKAVRRATGTDLSIVICAGRADDAAEEFSGVSIDANAKRFATHADLHQAAACLALTLGATILTKTLGAPITVTLDGPAGPYVIGPGKIKEFVPRG